MKKQIIVIILITCLLILLPACSPDYCHIEGLDDFIRNDGHGYSENQISSGHFLTVDFLNQHPYTDGNFVYDYNGELWISDTDRAFAWISYDDSEYEQAKQDCLQNGTAIIQNGQMIFGYIFHVRKNLGFPKAFTAFGYNDAEQKLVFIGFHCTRDDESEYVSLAETDFGAFLEHFYGEWYDWK